MKAFFASIAAAVFGATFLWNATDGLSALTTESARRIAVVRDNPYVPDVRLETMSGEMERLGVDRKRTVVAEFIYTSCPTICRTGGSYFARLRNQIVAEGLADQVRLISISFDPETDRRAELTQYGNIHDADGAIWTVARARATDLPRLLEAFGVVVISDGFGGFEHNTAMHIVSPDGRLRSVVDFDDVAGALREARKTLQ